MNLALWIIAGLPAVVFLAGGVPEPDPAQGGPGLRIVQPGAKDPEATPGSARWPGRTRPGRPGSSAGRRSLVPSQMR